MINLFGDSTLGNVGSKVLNRRLGVDAFGVDPAVHAYNQDMAQSLKDKQIASGAQDFEEMGFGDANNKLTGQPISVDPFGGIPSQQVGMIAPKEDINMEPPKRSGGGILGLVGTVAGLVA